jgi:hypothetical protein
MDTFNSFKTIIAQKITQFEIHKTKFGAYKKPKSKTKTNLINFQNLKIPKL